VKRCKIILSDKLIKEQLENQKDIIEAQTAKVRKLRDEKDITKKNFDDLKVFTLVAEVHTELDATRLADAAVQDLITEMAAKVVTVQGLNESLELAVLNAQTKRSRVELLNARLEKLRLKLKLNGTNRAAIKARMLIFKKKLAKV